MYDDGVLSRPSTLCNHNNADPSTKTDFNGPKCLLRLAKIGRSIRRTLLMMRSPRRRSHLLQMSKGSLAQIQNKLLIFSRDIQVLKTYGAAPYAAGLRKLEKQIKEKQTSVNEKIGVKVRYTPVMASIQTH